MDRQQKLIALVGGSVAVIVIGIYLILKKREDDDGSIEDDDDENDQDVKHSAKELPDLNTSVASAAQSVIEIMVPKKIVGSIIGKNGSNIRQLKNEFAVRLDFDKDDGGNEDNVERKLVIRGEREKVLSCEKKIKEFIANAPKYIDVDIFIPQEACGHVIGKGGQSIREICDVSGAKVKVDKDSSLGVLRRVTLSGTSPQVEYAKLLVQEKVELNKSLREKDRLKASVKIPESAPQPTKQYETVKLPITQEFFQVFVSAFDTPGHIWVQLVNEDGLKLDALNKELTEKYGKMDISEAQLDSGNVGSLCIAPFEHDNQWYRASIQAIHPDRTAELYYIDFGDVARVNFDSLKKIREEYKELPAHAVECYLPIIPSGPFWSKESESLFQEYSKCANWIPLRAKIIGSKTVNGISYPVLELMDTNENDLNVSGKLVESEEAKWDENEDYRQRIEQPTMVSDKALQEKELEIPSLDFDTSPSVSEQIKPVLVEEEIQASTEQNVQSGLDEGFLDNSLDINADVIKVTVEETQQSEVNFTDNSPPISKALVEEAQERGENVNANSPDINKAVVDETDQSKENLSNLNDLTSVREALPDETQESEDSGIMKDPLIETITNDVDTPSPKEQKSNTSVTMISQNSSHSTPTPEDDVTDDVIFDEGEEEGLKSPLTDKTEQHPMPSIIDVGKQPSVDDSFVDIDVETVDGTIKTSIHETVTKVANLEEAVSPEKEVSVESSIGSPDELNRTLIEDELSLVEDELQRSLDETSKKNVLMNSSMELARENLFLIESSDITDNDSFYSVRSDITVTDTDNASFMTATDRLTPTNDLSVSIPDLSSSSPYSSKTELSKTASKRASNGSKFEIQFIDESTHKILSRESLTTSFDNKQQKRLSAPLSPGKETTV